jgi:PAS domain S-box-containing protein
MSAGGLVQRSQASVASPPPGAAAVAAARSVADPLPAVAAPVGVPRTGDVTLARAARAGADMVGDACVVWRVAEDGDSLEPAATYHRDRRLRFALGAFLAQPSLTPSRHWPGQVASHGAPVRLRKARMGELGIDTGIGLRRANALLVPIVAEGRTVAVIAALRETSEPLYSLREEVVLRRIGVKAAAALGVRIGKADAGEKRGDGGPDTPNGRPPVDGPGWSPPPSWLMDHVGVGVWITDRQGVTTYVNSAMTELLAVPAPKIVGQPMREFLEDLPQMLRGEYCMDAERCDRRVTQPDGRHVWLEMTSTPLIDDEGARRGTVNTAVDVTDRKQIELAARQRVPRAHRRI